MSFTIEFDASGATDLGLYLMWSDQRGGSYGSPNSAGTSLVEPVVITLFADGITSTVANTRLNEHFLDTSYQDNYKAAGLGQPATGSIDISALDGASVARITFTTNLYTDSGNTTVVEGKTGVGNFIVDNIGITGAVGSTVSVVPGMVDCLN